MDIKTEHVSLEVAKKLKEIGYDEVETHYYDEVQKWLQEHNGINVVLQTYEEALLYAIQQVKAHEERLIKTDDKE